MGPSLKQDVAKKKNVVVLTDYLNRYVLAEATKDQTAETTVEVLMKKFLEYGLPERIITDNGTNFKSNLFKEICRLLQAAHLFTTLYHPQFDGLCERFNRTLASMLRGCVEDHQRDWDKYFPYLLHAYRAAAQESTGETPFYLIFGRPCRAPLDLQLKSRQAAGFPRPHRRSRTHEARYGHANVSGIRRRSLPPEGRSRQTEIPP